MGKLTMNLRTGRIAAKPERKAMTPEQAFFHTHAAYSWNPTAQTRAEGKREGAVRLARAEELYLRAHQVADVRCEWQDDPDGATSAGNASGPFEMCTLRHGERVLASLGSIDQPDEDYRRVVRAELALECADELRKIIKEA